MLSMSIPEMEIHMSNEPIALIITSEGYIKPFKIVARGRYFIVNTRRFKGIYTVNNKYRLTWGKTPIYMYAAQETNPIDPILVDLLNQYKKTNKLAQIKRKDIKHGSRLRILKTQMEASEAIPKLVDEGREKEDKLLGTISGVTDAIDKRVEDLKKKHHKDINVDDEQKAYILLKHLKTGNMIDDIEYADFTNKMTSNQLSFEMLVDELREKNIVTVSVPLDENVEDFIQDLGAQNAPDLAGFVQDLRVSKKGLKDMTAMPVKSFMSAVIVFALIIGVPIALIVIAGNWSAIEKMFTGAGGIKLTMPWDIANKGGFLFGLRSLLGI